MSKPMILTFTRQSKRFGSGYYEGYIHLYSDGKYIYSVDTEITRLLPEDAMEDARKLKEELELQAIL